MFKNLKNIADIAGTIFGLIVMWDLAKAIARDEVRKEMTSNEQIPSDILSNANGNSTKPHVTMNHKNNTIHIRITK